MKFKDSRKNRGSPQDQLRTLIRRAGDVAEGLDAAAFNRRPGEGRWSVGECLEHLNVSARLYLPVFAESIEAARARGLLGSGGPGRTLLGRLIVWSQEPPARMRFRTFEALEPEGGLDPAAVLEDFEALHEELIVRMNEASDLDWKKVRVRSVLDPRLRMSLGDWFQFMAAHGRRHVWQAARARTEVVGSRAGAGEGGAGGGGTGGEAERGG